MIYGEGPLDCKIALVGEAPGEKEVLLTQLLHSGGILQQSCYVTNVVKDRPPNNDISKYIKFSKEGECTWTSPEYDQFEKMLYDELDNCKANVIVLVGAIPLYALCRKSKITRQRGSILETVGGRKAIPIIHPSATFRQHIWQYYIARDIEKIKREAEFPKIILPDREIYIEPSYKETLLFISKCNYSTKVGVDIEVSRRTHEMSCISLAPNATEVMSIPFISRGESYWSPEQELQIMQLIAEVLENPCIEKVGQNFTFDAGFLHDRYGIATRNIQDTMVAMRVLYPDFQAALWFITSWYTNEPYYKDEGKYGEKLWDSFSGTEKSFWIYNAKDSVVCMEALPLIQKDLAEIGNYETYERQRKIIEPCLYIQQHGIRFDHERREWWRERLTKEIETLQAELNTRTGRSLNVKSTKQKKEYFYAELGIKPYTKKGSITTDADAMKRIARKGVVEARLALEITKRRDLLSKYINVKLSADGRFRFSVKPVGTKYGRISTSKMIPDGVGTNGQNWPEAMKGLWLADEGYLMYSTDLSQAETRILAVIAPELTLLSAFRDDVDVYKRVGGMLYNKPESDVDDNPGSSQLGTGEHSERDWAKRGVLGLGYDLGFKTFALKYEMPEPEAKFFIEKYHRICPGVRQYHAWVRAKLQKDRKLTNCMGRSYLFLGMWGDQLFKDAYAFIPQSTVADIIDDWGLTPMYFDQDSFRQLELLNQIHDEVLYQIPISAGFEEHKRIVMTVEKSLERTLQWKDSEFVIPAETKVGLRWGKKNMIKLKGNYDVAELWNSGKIQEKANQPIEASTYEVAYIRE